ncbi:MULTISPECIES: RNA polymerase sigma factor [Aestuariibaculum]|uniref:RNA polymerase sigma factor n=1 Tax=Aestuariibaculum marinum TaxID=2683592 RepID=A0A8J6U612_9FLAO|nr:MULTISPECIES: RNA polymerase sigma factor [Aestuariibaculum]MBD0824234.1 RNA polymerase sigma factor [Aestuariibaculum marinum]WMI66026.1 RNA polymerase sigma factor [Aestuariibaculum sp. YM273]
MKVSGKTIQYNSKEFKAIFERLFPSMYILASRILKSEEKGKDIAQEAFVKLWQKDTEDFTSEKALQAYLYVLVKNACISQLRKEKKISNTSLDEGLTIAQKSFLNEILREETYKLLHNAIKELSPQAERVVMLTLEGYRNQDIATELEITINSVKTVKKRAYNRLRELLGSQFVAIVLGNFIQFF